MIAAALLLVVVVAFRAVLGVTHMHDAGWLHNFSPVAAIALCGAVYLPTRVAFVLPLLALLLSDLAINLGYGVPLVNGAMLVRYIALGLVAALGFALRRNALAPRVIGASVLGSIIFFLLTNTVSWLAEPAYAKDAVGWLAALTTGLPGVRPTTLEFFRNSLVSDLLFTALFVFCMHSQQAREDSAPVRQQQPARW